MPLLIVRVADLLDAAVGVNTTFTVQAPPGATVVPEQVSALVAKSPAFAPLIVTAEMVRFAVPVFVAVSGSV
jgi:hypothetical protein